ncbi:MAG: hypothetical protein HYV09_11610 [Deltaproteobacteria bacterium]|nr:hypothetical protein [Deltaproteobacteria bacterium]
MSSRTSGLRRITLAVAGSIAALAPAACGPSMRHLVEGDMRFEHCYRIDDDPTTPLQNKRSCWATWTAQYTKGQDRSRVSYAKQRVRVLDGALAGAPAPAPVAVPPPSSPYAPPPAVAPKSGEMSGDVAAATAGPTTHSCTEACTKTWRTCASPCGTTIGCVTDCDERFRTCVKTCL